MRGRGVTVWLVVVEAQGVWPAKASPDCLPQAHPLPPPLTPPLYHPSHHPSPPLPYTQLLHQDLQPGRQPGRGAPGHQLPAPLPHGEPPTRHTHMHTHTRMSSPFVTACDPSHVHVWCLMPVHLTLHVRPWGTCLWAHDSPPRALSSPGWSFSSLQLRDLQREVIRYARADGVMVGEGGVVAGRLCPPAGPLCSALLMFWLSCSCCTPVLTTMLLASLPPTFSRTCAADRHAVHAPRLRPQARRPPARHLVGLPSRVQEQGGCGV